MAKDYAAAFYNSAAWRKTQAVYMQSRNYICEDCGGVACIVHHVRHITPGNINDPAITLAWDNLKAVCQTCHNAEHGSGRAVVPGIGFDDEGNVLYTPHTAK